MISEALTFVLKHEIGPFFDPEDPDVINGLHETKDQKRKIGFTEDPTDPGGTTSYGIAQNSHSGIDVTKLTLKNAIEIYRQEYWDKAYCDELPDNIDAIVFDCAVNCGVKTSIKLLQRALGAADDGIFGDQTREALALASPSLAKDLIEERRQYYHSIVYRKPAQGRFLAGWMSRCDDLENQYGS